MQLKDKVAVVTGAGSGIGRDIALAFAREGASVAICDIVKAGADETAGRIEAAGGRALAIEMDVTDEAAVARGVDEAAKVFGGIDVMMSNAGIQIVHAVEDFPYADFRRMLDIHVGGAFLLTKACIKHMYPKGSGSLIYMGSAHSHEASPLKSAYVAAKHGILGFSRVMAKEGAKHGVRSNVICPGFVKTPLVEKQIPEQARTLGISEEEVVKRVMLGSTVDGEFTTTEDVADLAIFLAGFRSNALTGQSITVSHGWHMG
ncbi:MULTISPECIES: 3-hydroxybutyrate dehydrogenase [unclassified Aureimonas]|uniref:3-hydroxybutyrate dehydrogenase n=1 Tax=unclassified Aureimonas TaxID=2615206 RepID=UPI0006F821A1|nr:MULTISPECIES: 3-hydroxybutyrate dehydrogenase [unclassified Aureimonas]KQT64130.1 3-hydroxybutyrate dehydrogenase [Aureimonas sp. Leaf427]KQT81319.1 3-hydroxybutyrate dehydrogenase [Aureimonas sp. Leaf460]